METAARKCVGCILAKGDRRSKIMVLTALPLDPPTNQLVSDLDEAALHSPVSETINLPVIKKLVVINLVTFNEKLSKCVCF